MRVSAVSISSVATGGKQPGQLGRDDFLMLLLTQLKNQDPLKPVDDTQFIAQLAQFSALEKMEQLDRQMALLLEVERLGQASSLIGKEVEASAGTSGETVRGTVDSVKVEQGSALLKVGSRYVTLSDVISIAEGEGSRE